ncbi:MAG TPA: glycoside hydrolase family 2 TIM barrel-domain containing protein [Opitutales bacterium]|jgi:beta-galactosidase|nr:glycoside hydrolase family 2 TIM barrel-domain containing protein [Opitutales bacterium]
MKMFRLFSGVSLTALALLFTHAYLPAEETTDAAASPQSLAGDWRFKLDRDNTGDNEKWYTTDLSDKIKLPGILQAQGYGDDISPTTNWVLTLGQDWWTRWAGQSKDLVDHFSQPGKVEVPFLAQPPKHYLGIAWYQRDIDIPDAWKDKRVVLFLERAHWQSTVYVDNKQYAYNDSLVAPHITDLGVLTPGKHRLTIRVDNRTMMTPQGHLVDAHSISDQLGAAWNGIVGRIELSATTPVWIDDAQAFPDLLKKQVHFKVKIGNETGLAGQGTLRVDFDSQHMVLSDGLNLDNPVAGNATANVTWDATGGAAEIDVPLTYPGVPWSEFTPAIQHMKVSLKGGAADDAQAISFGLRQVYFNDKDLLLNGSSINIRSTHFGGDFPLTGYPAMDAASWMRIFKICKSYGLNGMRFHSWCPPEAAFEAADELGFYLMPECGMWNTFGSPEMTQRLYDEAGRILKAYGNHPSFLFLSPSNEPGGSYTSITPEWAAAEYKIDPRRLYSAGTGWGATQSVTDGPQYAALASLRGALRGTGGWNGKDYGNAVVDAHIPVLSHEVGQYCAYPDFDVINEFTGYLKPSNYDIFKYIADQHGLLPLNKVFAWASGSFQLECYKEELEANLRSPGVAGFQMLDLHDYLGQGTALIGVLDAFWNSKGYVTPAYFRQFAGPVVPLVRLTKRVFTTTDSLSASAEIYNYGESPLPGSMPVWKIVNAAGKTVASGAMDKLDIKIGKNIPLGQIHADLSTLPAPAAYTLVVGLDGTQIANSWNFWVYPVTINADVPKDVLLTDSWPEARAALAAGKAAGNPVKVLFCPRDTDLDPALSPKMASTPVFWNIQMTVRFPNNTTPKFDAMLGLYINSSHAALAEFPTSQFCDWQWTPIVNGVKSVNLDKAPRDLYPIVWAIDDWNRNFRLGVIFESYVGDGGDDDGRLLVSAINLVNPTTSGAQQLRRSLLDYMANDDKFDPVSTLTLEQAGNLWVGGNPVTTPATNGTAAGPDSTARAFDPDLNDGTIAPPGATTAPAQ